MIRSLLIFVLALSFITVSFSGISMAQPPETAGPPEIQETANCVYRCAGGLQMCIDLGEEPSLCASMHDDCIAECFTRKPNL